VADYPHEMDEDQVDDDHDDDDDSIPRDERRYRERSRLTIGTLRTSSMRGTYWSTDANVRKLLKYRPSIEDMKLILKPMCYLFIGDAAHLGKRTTERVEYFYALQKQLVEYFLEKYSLSNGSSSVLVKP
jgi:hypothetical protein